MIRRNNRNVFSSVSRNARRAQAAIVRANRSNVKWMKRYTQRQAERQDRFTRFTAAIRKAFSFVPMVRSGLSAIWASMASVFVSMFVTPPTRPIRVAVNRNGILGTNKKRGRGKRRRNARAKAKLETGNTYEAMEPKQMLAADITLIAGDPTPPFPSINATEAPSFEISGTASFGTGSMANTVTILALGYPRLDPLCPQQWRADSSLPALMFLVSPMGL